MKYDHFSSHFCNIRGKLRSELNLYKLYSVCISIWLWILTISIMEWLKYLQIVALSKAQSFHVWDINKY